MWKGGRLSTVIFDSRPANCKSAEASTNARQNIETRTTKNKKTPAILSAGAFGE